MRQAILFSDGHKLRTLVTAGRALAAVVGVMVKDGIAVPVCDGRMATDIVREGVTAAVEVGVLTGEVFAADMVLVWVTVPVLVTSAVGV